MKEKFDMQKARHVADHGDLMHTIKMGLFVALDRIEELEQALCEAEARSLLNFQRYEAAMKGEQLTWAQTHDWDACHDEEKQDRMARAREWLKVEGKL